MKGSDHPVVRAIRRLLDEHGCWYETFEHEPVRTSEEAARTRPGYELRHGAKALIVRSGRSAETRQFVMFVFPADRKLDNRKAREATRGGSLRFAAEEEVEELTGGVQPGAVPPFGHLFDLPVYADRTLFANEKIVFNAGDRRFSIAMRSSDYLTLARPSIVDVV